MNGESNIGKWTMRLCDFMVDHLGEWDLIVCNSDNLDRSFQHGSGDNKRPSQNFITGCYAALRQLHTCTTHAMGWLDALANIILRCNSRSVSSRAFGAACFEYMSATCFPAFRISPRIQGLG